MRLSSKLLFSFLEITTHLNDIQIRYLINYYERILFNLTIFFIINIKKILIF